MDDGSPNCASGSGRGSEAQPDSRTIAEPRPGPDAAAMGFPFGKKARQAKALARSAARAADAALAVRLPESGLFGDGLDDEMVVDHWLAPGPVREAGIPRWRRQSLIAARKGIRVPTQIEAHLRFDGKLTADASGLERRLIRYRLVRLLDIPDDVGGREVDILDEGDEVAILDRRGTYCHVLCPDGSEGWVHRMTLGPMAQPPAALRDVVDAGDDPLDDAAAALPGDLEPDSFEDLIRVARLERLDPES